MHNRTRSQESFIYKGSWLLVYFESRNSRLDKSFVKERSILIPSLYIEVNKPMKTELHITDHQIHYDAFISYTHTDRDTRIAKLIQFQLEHYHIPKEIQLSTGKRSFKRVFRDNDELRASGRLSDAISTALCNSDYLIIICSSAASKSGWVSLEMDEFLLMHPTDHILTVLSDGELPDIIPKALLQRESNSLGFNLLSCDYRGNLRKAKKTELPRLIAGMLGCQYDDLIQRAKKYRQRILIRVLSACVVLLTVLLTYYIKTNRTISLQRDTIAQQNHDIKVEQSINIASMSDRIYHERHRTEAIRYALEAVNCVDQYSDCPAPTVLALQQSTHAYTPKENNRLVEMHTYSASSLVDTFVTYEWDNKSYLACTDGLGIAYVWDVFTGELLLQVSASERYKDIVFIKDYVCLFDKYGFKKYSLHSMKEMGDYSYPRGLHKISSVRIATSDQGILIPLYDENNKYVPCLYNIDKDQYMTYGLQDKIEPRSVLLSNNNKWIVLEDVQYSDKRLHRIIIINTINKAQYCLDEYTDLSDFLLLNEDNLIVIGHRTLEGVGQVYVNGARASWQSDLHEPGSVACYSLESGDKKWENTWEYWLPGTGNLTLFDGDKQSRANAYLFAYSEAMSRIIDLNTGSTLNEIMFPGRILCVFPESYYTDQSMTAILKDGSYATFCFDSKDMVRHQNVLASNILRVAKTGEYIVGLTTDYDRFAVAHEFVSYSINGIDTALEMNVPAVMSTKKTVRNTFDENRTFVQDDSVENLYVSLHDQTTNQTRSLDQGFYSDKRYYFNDLVDGLYKWSDDGESVLIATTDGLALYNQDGHMVGLLDLPSTNDCWFCFCGNYLFILDGDPIKGEILHQYDKATAVEIQSTVLRLSRSMHLGLDWPFCKALNLYHIEEDKYIVLYHGFHSSEHSAYVLNHGLEIEQHIENGVDYDPGSDCFIVDDYTKGLHSMKRLSIDGLIKLAKSQIE